MEASRVEVEKVWNLGPVPESCENVQENSSRRWGLDAYRVCVAWVTMPQFTAQRGDEAACPCDEGVGLLSAPLLSRMIDAAQALGVTWPEVETKTNPLIS